MVDLLLDLILLSSSKPHILHLAMQLLPVLPLLLLLGNHLGIPLLYEILSSLDLLLSQLGNNQFLRLVRHQL